MKRTTPLPKHPPGQGSHRLRPGPVRFPQAAVVEGIFPNAVSVPGKSPTHRTMISLGCSRRPSRSVFADKLGRSVDCSADTIATRASSDIDRLPRELREHARYKVDKSLAAGAMGEVYLPWTVCFPDRWP